MIVTKEIISFDELYEQSWEGAIDTLNTVIDNGLEEDLMTYLEELFQDGTDETTLNDYLWYNSDEIFITLGIEDE